MKRTGFARAFFTFCLLAVDFPELPASAFASSLAGSEWGIHGKPERFVQFRADNKVIGNGGCNSFSGIYAATGSRLTFGPLATTRKMCLPVVMQSETTFLGALSQTVSFVREQGRLILFDAKGAAILELRHRDWD